MTSPKVSKEPGFWAQLLESLAPKVNRVPAGVAFFRTLKQGITGPAVVTAGGGIVLTAQGLTEINWLIVLLAVGAVVLSALGTALDAGFNVLQNGVPKGYIRGAVRQLQAQRASEMDTNLRDAVVDAAAAVEKSEAK